MSDLELDDELSSADELLKELQQEERDNSERSLKPPAQTVHWRQRDSKGDVVSKRPRVQRTVKSSAPSLDNPTRVLFSQDNYEGPCSSASICADADRRTGSLLEELKELLDTALEVDLVSLHEPPPTSASSDWSTRISLSAERWRESRPDLVVSMLKGEDVCSHSCQMCGNKKAVVRCGDCLPYPFLCAGCDIDRHGHYPLHNRDAIVSGFLEPLPPTACFTHDDDQPSLKQLIRFLPVHMPDCVCGCPHQAFKSSPERSVTLITINVSMTDLQRSGYWPGSMSFCTVFSTDVFLSFREMKLAAPGLSTQAFVKMLQQRTARFGRTGNISADLFGRSFHEWVVVKYELEKLCQEDYFTCPACVPNMLAVSVDGNRKHYRFKGSASTNEPGCFDGVFIYKDEEASRFVEYVQQKSTHVSGKRVCGASEWTAARELSRKSSSKIDEEGLEIAVCRHGVLLGALNMYRGEIFAYPLFLQQKLAATMLGNITFLCSDVACKYFPYLQKVAQHCPELQHLLDMRPFLSVMHAKAHAWKCEVRWGGAYQEGAGSTIGEEVEQVNSFLSRIAITTKYMSKAGRTDMITMQGMSWNKRKFLNMGSALVRRYQRVQKALQEQKDSLQMLKTELAVQDDVLHKWVTDVQHWAEEPDYSSIDGHLADLRKEVMGLTMSIKHRTQRLYRQTDSNKRRHRIRQKIWEEKKQLAVAVEQYNRQADPSQKIVSTEDLLKSDTCAWPWQIPGCESESTDLLTKRRVFDKVMAVRRLQEEERVLCAEMMQHWRALITQALKLEELSRDIASGSVLLHLSEVDARNGLLSTVIRKRKELQLQTQSIREGYQNILNHPLSDVVVDSSEEDEEDSEPCDSCSDDSSDKEDS
ncbi:uncharacterized protein [Hoplias malabaricus]|uniref:uncharacterized protein isoform X2 n=1 Tax=Hoplias malabaricus TaxID=27720 RepID=UPI0034627753